MAAMSFPASMPHRRGVECSADRAVRRLSAALLRAGGREPQGARGAAEADTRGAGPDRGRHAVRARRARLFQIGVLIHRCARPLPQCVPARLGAFCMPCGVTCYAAERCMGLHVSVATAAVANACYGMSLFRIIQSYCCMLRTHALEFFSVKIHRHMRVSFPWNVTKHIS